MARERAASDAASEAALVASAIIARADSDLAFVARITGDSQHLLVRHFQHAIERELGRRGVVYGDHPLLRPMVEAHGRELTEFVVSAVGLQHRFGIAAMERLAGDPSGLLRVDLWDTLRNAIEDAERHLVSPAGGLSAIVAEVDAMRGGRGGVS